MTPIDGKPSWKIRRRIVAATLLWCGAMVTYLAIWGRPVDLSETIANGCLILMASVIGSYVFGAVWDDKNFMSQKREAEYAPSSYYPPSYNGPAMPEPPPMQRKE